MWPTQCLSKKKVFPKTENAIDQNKTEDRKMPEMGWNPTTRPSQKRTQKYGFENEAGGMEYDPSQNINTENYILNHICLFGWLVS